MGDIAMSKYILYSSEGCHLCEQADALIKQVITPADVSIIDIVSDDSLVELYGMHIPVFENTHSGEKLYWPFSVSDIEKMNN